MRILSNPHRWILAGMGIMICGISLIGCKKDHQPNKIVDGLPFKTDEVIFPANAVQEMGLARKLEIHTVVVSLNQLTLQNPSLTLLTPANPNYTFDISEAHIGTMHCTIQFQDGVNAAVFPVTSSTGTVKYVAITGIGASSLFNYTDSSLITVTVIGNFTSNLFLTGSMPFTGVGAAVGYSMTFVVPAPGARVNLEGQRGGLITVSGGSSPGGPISMSLNTDNNHSIDGTLSWDGMNGGIHLDNFGIGFVVTESARVPIN